MPNPVDTYNYPGSFQSESEQKISPKPNLAKNSKNSPQNAQISGFQQSKPINSDLEESENFILSSDEKFTGRSGIGCKRKEEGYGLLENVFKVTGGNSEIGTHGRSFEKNEEAYSNID